MAPCPYFEIRTPTGPTVLHGVYPSRLVRLQARNAGDGGTKHNRHLVLWVCRFKFVHGKENLHPTSFLAKNKSEAQMCESTSSSGLCTPSLKSHFAYQVMASTEAAALASSPKPNNTIDLENEKWNNPSPRMLDATNSCKLIFIVLLLVRFLLSLTYYSL